MIGNTCSKRWFSLLAAQTLIASAASAVELPKDPQSGLDPTRISLPQKEGTVLGLRGSMDVSGNIGDAAWRYEFRLPKWRSLLPELAIRYSSTEGAGILGQGFLLEPPSIQRITRLGTPNSLSPLTSSLDRDLIQTADGSYRAKMDQSYRRYTMKDGVIQMDAGNGQVWTFGADASSRVNEGDYTFRWNVTEIRDAFGNRVVFKYEKRLQQSYLDEIICLEADGRPLYSIDFSYENHPRPFFFMNEGVNNSIDQILRSVQLNWLGAVESQRIWKVDLSYDSSSRPVLQKIRESGRTDQDAFPEITFKYSDQAKFQDLQASTSNPTFLEKRPLLYEGHFKFMDFNGDGLPDILAKTSLSNSQSWTVWYNQGNAVFKPVQLPSSMQGWDFNSWGHLLADFDGDRLVDLGIKPAAKFFGYLNQSRGEFSEKGQIKQIQAKNIPEQLNNPQHGSWVDLNADSRVDYLEYNAGKYRIHWNRSNPGQDLTFAVQDFGNTPLEAEFKGTQTWGDINGDGLADMAYYETWSRRLKIRINRGNGTFLAPYTLSVATTEDLPSFPSIRDLDGDGLGDLIFWSRGNVPRIYGQTAQGFMFLSDIGKINNLKPADITSLEFGDFNGNGSTDILLINSNSQDIAFIDPYAGHSSKRPFMLKSIVSELGSVTTLQYASALRLGEPGPGHQVLQEMSSRGSIAGATGIKRDQQTEKKAYSFESPAFDYHQNEFLGFAKVSIDNYWDTKGTTGIRTVQHYHTLDNKALYKGLLHKQQTYTIPGVREIERKEVLWSSQEPFTGVVTPFQKSVSTWSFEKDGTSRLERKDNDLVLNTAGTPLQLTSLEYNGGTVYRSFLTRYAQQADLWLPQLPETIELLSQDKKVLIGKKYQYFPGTSILQQVSRLLDNRWQLHATYGISPQGSITWARQANGQETHIKYDESSYYLPSEVYADIGDVRLSKKYQYDFTALEKLHQYRDENQAHASQLFTEYTWDGLGRLASITMPGETEATWRFHYEQGSVGQFSTIHTYSKGIREPNVSLYDSFQRKVASAIPAENSGWIMKDLVLYEMAGRVARKYRPFPSSDWATASAPDTHADIFEYDDQGRIELAKLANGGQERVRYSSFWKKTINPEQEETVLYWDNLNRTCAIEQSSKESIDPESRSCQASPASVPDSVARIDVVRDARDLIVALAMPDGETRSFSYDQASRLLSSQSSKIGRQEFAYTPTDKVSTTRTFGVSGTHLGTVFKLYDGLDRETERRYFYDEPGDISNSKHLAASQLAFQWTYDKPQNFVNRLSNTLGKASLLKIRGQHSIAYGYDLYGNLSDEKFENRHQLTQEFDAQGRLISVTYPDAEKVMYNYSSITGVMKQVSGAISASLDYDSYNRQDHATYGEGQKSFLLQQVFDDVRNLPKEVYLTFGNDKLFSEAIGSFDLNDRVQSLHHFDRAQGVIEKAYDYDGRGQVKSETLDFADGSVKNLNYDYSKAGLLKMKNSQALDRHAGNIRFQEAVYQFGEFGRVASGPNYDTVIWNAEHQIDMLSLTNGVRTHNRYFPDQKRFSETIDRGDQSSTTFFPSDYYEVDGTQGLRTKHYFIAGKRVASRTTGKLQYSFGDAIGSQKTTASEEGKVLATRDYYAFGDKLFESKSTDFDRYQFANGFFDENAGFYQFQTRNYDPRLGQFLSPDLYFFNKPENCLKSPIECNLYSYARNNPLIYLDHSGKYALKISLGIQGAVVGSGSISPFGLAFCWSPEKGFSMGYVVSVSVGATTDVGAGVSLGIDVLPNAKSVSDFAGKGTVGGITTPVPFLNTVIGRLGLSGTAKVSTSDGGGPAGYGYALSLGGGALPASVSVEREYTAITGTDGVYGPNGQKEGYPIISNEPTPSQLAPEPTVMPPTTEFVDFSQASDASGSGANYSAERQHSAPGGGGGGE